jgi:hypothetical protein
VAVLNATQYTPLSLRKDHRLIFGPEREYVTGNWRKLHNEELDDFYSTPNVIQVITSRRMRWEGHVARTGKKRNAYWVLVGKP